VTSFGSSGAPHPLRTRREIGDALAQYRAGLEACLVLLRRLEAVAEQQRLRSDARDYQTLAAEGETRQQLTHALLAIEPGLRDARTLLQGVDPAQLDAEPNYRLVTTLRAQVRELIDAIQAVDAASLRSLADAELARRSALASLEAGEHTLAAYRRVLVPDVGHASLVDRRG